jgi:hypothetical protein
MTMATKRYVPPGAITLAETARRLGLKYISRVHDLRTGGDIQAWRVGRQWWVVESSVQTYLEKQKNEGVTAWTDNPG